MYSEGKKRLYIFTISYPYDFSQERNFIDPEMEGWIKNYQQVILVPAFKKGILDSQLSSEVQVDLTLSELYQNENRLKSLLKFSFWRVLLLVFFQIVKSQFRWKFNLYLNAIFFVVRMIQAKSYLSSLRGSVKSDVYSFWNTYVTAAIADFSDWSGSRWTRVHGDDFYPERQGGIIPLERKTYQRLDKVVFVSKLAEAYWRNRHPHVSTVTEVSYIGVREPENWQVVPTLPSRNPIKLFSCSGLNPIKRMDLCSELILEWNRRHWKSPIEWHHLGATTFEIDQFIGKTSGAIGHGWMSQTSVLNWILDNNPWFLISVSSSEGFPVSMQESLISGVPILAAANGGMVEAVEMSNGYLLPETPTYMDFEKAMLHVLSLSNEEILEARQIALNVGNAHFLR